MPNGKPGDHPLTDILVHKMKVYGQEADDLIRRIAELSSRRELDEWWDREVGWSPDKDLVLRKARTRFDELLRRAKQSGWETK
jgi:hypothetical protein